MKKTQRSWNSTLSQKSSLKPKIQKGFNSTLEPKKPMNKVSKKQAKINREDALLKEQIIIQMIEDKGHTYCQLCGKRTPQSRLQLIHLKGKGRGGSKTDPKNKKVGCLDCHFGPKMGDHYQEEDECKWMIKK